MLSGATDCDVKKIDEKVFVKIDRKRFRIQNELNKKRDNFQLTLAASQAALIKTARLERFKTFLETRENKLIRRDVENIKDLEKLKKEERLLKKKADASTVAISEPVEASFFSVSGDWIFSFFLLRDFTTAQ